MAKYSLGNSLCTSWALINSYAHHRLMDNQVRHHKSRPGVCNLHPCIQRCHPHTKDVLKKKDIFDCVFTSHSAFTKLVIWGTNAMNVGQGGPSRWDHQLTYRGMIYNGTLIWMNSNRMFTLFRKFQTISHSKNIITSYGRNIPQWNFCHAGDRKAYKNTMCFTIDLFSWCIHIPTFTFQQENWKSRRATLE